MVCKGVLVAVEYGPRPPIHTTSNPDELRLMTPPGEPALLSHKYPQPSKKNSSIFSSLHSALPPSSLHPSQGRASAPKADLTQAVGDVTTSHILLSYILSLLIRRGSN